MAHSRSAARNLQRQNIVLHCRTQLAIYTHALRTTARCKLSDLRAQLRATKPGHLGDELSEQQRREIERRVLKLEVLLGAPAERSEERRQTYERVEDVRSGMNKEEKKSTYTEATAEAGQIQGTGNAGVKSKGHRRHTTQGFISRASSHGCTGDTESMKSGKRTQTQVEVTTEHVIKTEPAPRHHNAYSDVENDDSSQDAPQSSQRRAEKLGERAWPATVNELSRPQSAPQQRFDDNPWLSHHREDEILLHPLDNVSFIQRNGQSRDTTYQSCEASSGITPGNATMQQRGRHQRIRQDRTIQHEHALHNRSPENADIIDQCNDGSLSVTSRRPRTGTSTSAPEAISLPQAEDVQKITSNDRSFLHFPCSPDTNPHNHESLVLAQERISNLTTALSHARAQISHLLLTTSTSDTQIDVRNQLIEDLVALLDQYAEQAEATTYHTAAQRTELQSIDVGTTTYAAAPTEYKDDRIAHLTAQLGHYQLLTEDLEAALDAERERTAALLGERSAGGAVGRTGAGEVDGGDLSASLRELTVLQAQNDEVVALLQAFILRVGDGDARVAREIDRVGDMLELFGEGLRGEHRGEEESGVDEGR